MSFIEDLRSLDYEDPGGWPTAFKMIAAVLVAALIIGAGYWFKIKDDIATYQGHVNAEQGLRTQFQDKHRKAAQLEEYREQFAAIQEKLDELLKQLPTKTQIPRLLQTVSQTAIETGIDVVRFEPQAEVLRDVFAERPIALKMAGTYHQFGQFVSEIADERRVIILTMHDLALEPDEFGNLVLSGTAKTYRSIDENEQFAAQEAANAQNARGTR